MKNVKLITSVPVSDEMRRTPRLQYRRAPKASVTKDDVTNGFPTLALQLRSTPYMQNDSNLEEYFGYLSQEQKDERD